MRSERYAEVGELTGSNTDRGTDAGCRWFCNCCRLSVYLLLSQTVTQSRLRSTVGCCVDSWTTLLYTTDTTVRRPRIRLAQPLWTYSWSRKAWVGRYYQMAWQIWSKCSEKEGEAGRRLFYLLFFINKVTPTKLWTEKSSRSKVQTIKELNYSTPSVKRM